jgi:hypothetical protein
MPVGALYLPGSFGGNMSGFAQQVQILAVHAFVIPGAGPGTPAQQAVQAVLLQGAGLPLADQPASVPYAGLPSSAVPGQGTPAYAAARRIAALPSVTWHAWLAAHVAALRAGQLTLAQLP